MAQKKKKGRPNPRKPKIDRMAGVPRPKPVSFRSSSQSLEHAREYPLLGCWVMNGWQENGFTPVVVARSQPEGKVVYGAFLVDFYCLGVKNAYWKVDVPFRQFNRDLPRLCSGSPETCAVELAHELIYGSIEYARRIGFEPQVDFEKASLVLDPPDAHPRKKRVKFGKDGKPLFIAGPHDNARAIIDTLMRTAGKDNFDYILMLEEP